MKLKTKILILLSAGLVALSLEACGEEKGSENGTNPQNELMSGEGTYELSEDTITGDDYYETRGLEEGSEPNAPETDMPVISETVVSDPSEETEDVIGPVPPPATEDPTEPPAPDFVGIETNEDGAIELPFVPFPED